MIVFREVLCFIRFILQHLIVLGINSILKYLYSVIDCNWFFSFHLLSINLAKLTNSNNVFIASFGFSLYVIILHLILFFFSIQPSYLIFFCLAALLAVDYFGISFCLFLKINNHYQIKEVLFYSCFIKSIFFFLSSPEDIFSLLFRERQRQRQRRQCERETSITFLVILALTGN